VHELVSIPMPESDGFRALGFVFLSVLRKWDGIICEVALDSTCEFIYCLLLSVGVQKFHSSPDKQGQL
jgi:hypothetical protein